MDTILIASIVILVLVLGVVSSTMLVPASALYSPYYAQKQIEKNKIAAKNIKHR